ncbi:MAG: hypothetical protein CMJ58_00495 [Planctomycetaceae bacterium]|nr:hypothetical protein [Planctomycetaceae bacterium]
MSIFTRSAAAPWQAALLVIAFATGTADGQTLLSHYKFDNNLLNASSFVDTNGTPAPDGTFRVGTDSATAVASTATFTTGVDGTANGAILFNGLDQWVDVTTAGHPGAPVAATGDPYPGSATGDPQASSGPGLVSGTIMAWVKSTNTSGARWIMGNLNAVPEGGDPNPFDDNQYTQAFLAGWSGSRLQAFPRASNSSVSRFIVQDPSPNDNLDDWADGEWRHVAWQWNGAAESGSGEPTFASVYLDGVRLGASSTNYFLNPPDFQEEWQFPMAIGARNNRGALDGFFDGAIDDLRIYAESLTDQQILDIYNSMAPSSDNPDFNGDMLVNGSDFLIWQRGLGIGTMQSEGDANGDGFVTDADLVIWQAAYGQATGAPTAAPVPEPAAAVLAAMGMAFLRLGINNRSRATA